MKPKGFVLGSIGTFTRTRLGCGTSRPGTRIGSCGHAKSAEGDSEKRLSSWLVPI